MRALALALPLAVALLAGPAPARADEGPKLELTVGDESDDLGILARCDDLSVVAIKANGKGVRALRPGTTICSFDRSGGAGIRAIYRIVVRAPPPAEEQGGGKGPAKG